MFGWVAGRGQLNCGLFVLPSPSPHPLPSIKNLIHVYNNSQHVYNNSQYILVVTNPPFPWEGFLHYNAKPFRLNHYYIYLSQLFYPLS